MATFRGFEKGLAGGGWRPIAAKKKKEYGKSVPQNGVLLLRRGHREKRAEKRPESTVLGGISLRQPPLSANPISKPLIASQKILFVIP